MSKIADTEANATSLDSLVNDNALVPTLRNGPKPSYQYLVNGWNSEFDLALEQYKESRGFNTKGTFVDGFTYELPNDVGLDADGNPWILIDTSSLPVVVSESTTPTNPPYKQVAYGTASQVSTNTSDTVQSFVDSFALKIFQSPTDGGLTKIQTRTVETGEVYEVRKTSDDSLATIYSDAAGANEIAQDGTSNVSDSAGIVEFYIVDGDYYIEVSGGSSNFKASTSYLGNVVYVDALGLGGIIDDTVAIQSAIDKAVALQYVKKGVKVVLRAPINYYQVSEPLLFDERWNVSFECEVSNRWNRSEVGDVDTLGGNIHWIGNNTDSLFDFGQYCFGVRMANIVVNGRGNLKLAYDMSAETPSVLRDFYFENCGAIECDFGAVHGGISGTDLAPVTWINPTFNNNSSAAMINNSGNLSLTVIGGFITNNGHAPSTGNSFIPDVDNVGSQIIQRAGHSWLEKITVDGSGDKLAASGENIRCLGGSIGLSGWDDTPEVVSVNVSGTTQAVSFGHWRHFDGSMTKANAPISIKHNAPCAIEMGSGLNVFGDIEINTGTNSGISMAGVNFLSSESGFTGTGTRGLAGIIKNKLTDDVVLAVGGNQQFVGDDAAPVKRSVISRQNRPSDYYKSETGSVETTFTVKDNGQWEYLTNVWYDTSSSQYKSINAGGWSRKLVTPSGVEQLNSGTASAANDVLVTSISSGFRRGTGGNGGYQLELSSNKFSFDIPLSGTVTRGDTFMRASATPGGKAADIVTTSGTVGSTAVVKPFGDIDV